MLIYHFLAYKFVSLAIELWERGEYMDSVKVISIVFLTTMIDFSRYIIKI